MFSGRVVSETVPKPERQLSQMQLWWMLAGLKHNVSILFSSLPFVSQLYSPLCSPTFPSPQYGKSHSDPLQSNAALRDFCRQEGIQYMGYSTLGSQWQFKVKATPGSNPVLSHHVIARVAATRGCSTAQVPPSHFGCERGFSLRH